MSQLPTLEEQQRAKKEALKKEEAERAKFMENPESFKEEVLQEIVRILKISEILLKEKQGESSVYDSRQYAFDVEILSETKSKYKHIPGLEDFFKKIADALLKRFVTDNKEHIESVSENIEDNPDYLEKRGGILFP